MAREHPQVNNLAVHHKDAKSLFERFFDLLCDQIGEDIEQKESLNIWQSACIDAGVELNLQSVNASHIEDLSYHLEIRIAHGDANRDLVKMILKQASVEKFVGLEDIQEIGNEQDVITIFLGPDSEDDTKLLKFIWCTHGNVSLTPESLHTLIQNRANEGTAEKNDLSKLKTSDIQEACIRLVEQSCLSFQDGKYKVTHASDWWLKDSLTFSYGAEWKIWFQSVANLFIKSPYSRIPKDKRQLIIQFSNGITPKLAFESLGLNTNQHAAAGRILDAACKATALNKDQITSMRILHIAPSIFRRKVFKDYDLKITSNDITTDGIDYKLRKAYANKGFTVATASAGIHGLFIQIPEGKQSITLTFTWSMEGGRKTVHNVRYILGRTRKNAWLYSEDAERKQCESPYTPAELHPYAFFELTDFARKRDAEESWEDAICKVPRMKHSIESMQKFNNHLTINETIKVSARSHCDCWQIGL